MQQVEIRFRGQMDREWTTWLGELFLAHTASSDTFLAGTVTNQAVLYGLPERLAGLGLALVSVSAGPVAPGTAEEVRQM